jgi:hypothetical protein
MPHGPQAKTSLQGWNQSQGRPAPQSVSASSQLQ